MKDIKFQTQENEKFETMRKLVLIDRMKFLSSLHGDSLSEGTLLDLQHQSILRILNEYVRHDRYEEVIRSYCYDLSSRKRHLQDAKEYIKGELQDGHYFNKDDIKFQTAGGFTYSAHDSEMADEFLNLGLDVAKQGDICFSNNAGFGFFNVSEIKEMHKVQCHICDSSRYASLGALMYYGFTHEKNACFIPSSIKVLAMVLQAQLGRLDIWKGNITCAKDMIAEELSGYLSFYKGNISHSVLYKNVLDFLVLHEQGHYLSNENHRFWIEDALSFAGIDKSYLYQVRFPPKELLGAWGRIREGKGSVEDALFLLGDYIANMNILYCISRPQLYLMKLFHWWLVKKPGIKSRPRGFSAFLCHAINPRLNDASKELGKILLVAKNDPANLARTLVDFEEKYWNELISTAYTGANKDELLI